MQNFLRLKSITARLLFLLFILCPMSGLVLEFSSGRIIHPTEWYFVTVEDGGIDINSPNKKMIIRMEFKKAYDNYDRYLRECDLVGLANIGASPVAVQYKNIELCNVAKISGDEFKIRNEYFRSQVDELWRDYYWDHVEKIAAGIFKGLLAWFGLTTLIILIRWVLRGNKA